MAEKVSRASAEERVSEAKARVDKLRELLERENLGFEYRRNGFALAVEMRNGRNSRSVVVDESCLESVSEIPLGSIVFLGDYDAVLDTESGTIEAALRSASRGVASAIYLHRRLARTSSVAPVSADVGVDVDNVKTWQILLKHPRHPVRISQISEQLATLLNPARPFKDRLSMKIPVDGSATHDSSLMLLESLGHAILFDVDLLHGIAIDFSSRSRPLVAKRNERSEVVLSYPRHQYLREPLELYRYGQSADGLPLLQFLAFYQSVEYFFPVYADGAALRTVRNEVADPRFNPRDDEQIARLLRIAKSASGFASEKEQMKSAVKTATSVPRLRDFLRRHPELDYFTQRKQKIRGASPLKIDESLTEGVAERLYAIRCRIVHTKQSGGDSGIELLLPSSGEAAALGPDVDLMRFIAQSVLLDQAIPLEVPS
ncbi:hypothetical protein [Cellulosimicrobium sp. 72-3]|uniref:hypothetical protein n=1 Tax=Cellulosimicrobium sp. 72-3 TaxID=2731680 RepID=UPI00148ED903|nr:hypothetical protein [Cellulosimicrobium sp. 72-3]